MKLPPYSPDLSLPDFHLKLFLRASRKMKARKMPYIDSKDQNYNIVQKDANGEYFDKIKNF